ncbi:unnamed protein product [Tetraodon nigroviridis]|uniref:(spotted green pufferfish) hypothetical protein n=1 Tax=Tetraodon nigroviridis TaxID=99883 RepID=Q4RQ18_TETNG|nr:unnamed protein product [Tetraodon nigroviridis]
MNEQKAIKQPAVIGRFSFYLKSQPDISNPQHSCFPNIKCKAVSEEGVCGARAAGERCGAFGSPQLFSMITRVIFCVFLETDFVIYKRKMSLLFQDNDVDVAETELKEDNTPPSPKSTTKEENEDTNEDKEGSGDEEEAANDAGGNEDVEMASQTPAEAEQPAPSKMADDNAAATSTVEMEEILQLIADVSPPKPAGHSSMPFNWLGLSGGGTSHSMETSGCRTKTFIPGSLEERIM